MNIVEYILRFRETGAAKAIGSAQGKIERLDRSVGHVNSTLSTFKGILAGAAITGFAASVVKVTSDFERYNAVLSNTFNSNQKAAESIRRITEFAAATPFQVDELIDSFVRLSNQGFVPDMSALRALGDLASSTGKEFDQLAQALLDARVGEFERLKEFGIRAQKAGDQVTFTFKGIQTTVAFTESTIQDYLLSLGQVQGVSGSMAAISQTLGGRLSNLQDRWTALQLELGQKLRPVIEQVINGFGGILAFGSQLIDFIAHSALGFDGLAITIGILTGAITAWIAVQKIINVLMVANPIGLVVAAVGLLIAGIVALYKNSETVRGVFQGIFRVFKTIFNFLKAVYIPIFKRLGEAFKEIGRRVVEFLQKPIAMATKTFRGFLDILERIPGIGKLIRGIRDSFSKGFQEGVADFRKEQEKASIPVDKAEVAAGDTDAQNPTAAATTPATLQQPTPPTTPTTVSSAAPKQFNINIENLVRQFTVEMATTVEAGAEQVKERMQQALLEAVADVQIAR